MNQATIYYTDHDVERAKRLQALYDKRAAGETLSAAEQGTLDGLQIILSTMAKVAILHS